MTAWVWIDPWVVVAVHEQQLAEHGGSAGIRDMGLLESALERPRNLLRHGRPDFASPAASYGFGIARNHPFVDGNKRTALVCTELFLHLNGYRLDTDDTACVLTMLAVAAGELTEAGYANWLREHCVRN